MSKILTNFLTKPPAQLGFFRRKIPIGPMKMEGVKKGLYKNLHSSCCSYVEGIIDLDQQFIKNTTSPYLYNLIQPQIRSLKLSSKQSTSPVNIFAKQLQHDKHSRQMQSIRQKESKESKEPKEPKEDKKQQSILPSPEILPYVVFGGNLQSRINNHPSHNILRVTRNRFFTKQSQTNTGMFQRYYKYQLYGFECAFLIRSAQKVIVITMEGDIDKDEYYVVDLNYQFEGEVVQQQKTI